MAAQIEKQLGAKTTMVVGSSGEFTVWVGERKVAEKDWEFPDPDDVVDAVREALAEPPGSPPG